MVALAYLESFDTTEPEGPPPISPEFEAGRAQGYAEGLAAAKSEASYLSREVLQAFADLTLTFREAQNLTLAELRPLFEILLQQILPETLTETLAPRLQAALIAAAEGDLRRPLTLQVAAEDRAGVEALLVGVTLPITVSVASQLHSGQYLIVASGQASCLDIGAFRSKIAEALAIFTETPTERRSHV